MTLRIGMPQQRASIGRWAQLMTFKKITQTVTDGLVVNADEEVCFRGVLQPLSPREIQLKPEGQRAWTWLRLQCFTSCPPFNVNDRVQYDGREYKIMAELDYTLSGCREYHVVKDYQ